MAITIDKFYDNQEDVVWDDDRWIRELEALPSNEILPNEDTIFDIRNLLVQCIDSIETIAKERNIEVHSEMDIPIFLSSNNEKLRMVFHHILLNAVLYNQDSGKVFLRVIESGNRCLVEVTDTGFGITPEKQEFLFSFQKTAYSEGNHSDGATSSMGLALCKEWLLELNGKINLESRIGEGTKVTIELPI